MPWIVMIQWAAFIAVISLIPGLPDVIMEVLGIGINVARGTAKTASRTAKSVGRGIRAAILGVFLVQVALSVLLVIYIEKHNTRAIVFVFVAVVLVSVVTFQVLHTISTELQVGAARWRRSLSWKETDEYRQQLRTALVFVQAVMVPAIPLLAALLAPEVLFWNVKFQQALLGLIVFGIVWGTFGQFHQSKIFFSPYVLAGITTLIFVGFLVYWAAPGYVAYVMNWWGSSDDKKAQETLAKQMNQRKHIVTNPNGTPVFHVVKDGDLMDVQRLFKRDGSPDKLGNGDEFKVIDYEPVSVRGSDMLIPILRADDGVYLPPPVDQSKWDYIKVADTNATKLAPQLVTSTALDGSEPGKQLLATQDFEKYSAARWCKYGPGVDINNGTVTQLWMSHAGYITYTINVAEVNTGAPTALVVRLSSELKGITNTNPMLASDVQLRVNNTNVGTQRVVPDNNQGTDVTWIIPAGVVKPGANEFTFRVQGGLAHGLCIYSPLRLKQDISSVIAASGRDILQRMPAPVFLLYFEYMNINITVPVRDENQTLPHSIPFLMDHLKQAFFNYDWFVIIADNGSTQNIAPVVEKLQQQYDNLFLYSQKSAGRGRAVLFSWQKFPADFSAYIDADLDLHPQALDQALVALQQGADLAAGSRRHPHSRVEQTWLRRIISSTGHQVTKQLFKNAPEDGQCGVKMIRATALKQLAPQVHETGWFFDTELLLLAKKFNLKVVTVPVDHVVNRLGARQSKVFLFRDGLKFLRALYRFKQRGL